MWIGLSTPQGMKTENCWPLRPNDGALFSASLFLNLKSSSFGGTKISERRKASVTFDFANLNAPNILSGVLPRQPKLRASSALPHRSLPLFSLSVCSHLDMVLRQNMLSLFRAGFKESVQQQCSSAEYGVNDGPWIYQR